ncbi:MAG: class I adenylate cyclase [Chromatiales bacterium]|jgi:adenylate cyclase class 1
MTETIDFEQGFGRKELNKIRRRFNALHMQRLKLLEDELSRHQRDFLTLLPLLLHINHPALPGYISSEVPAGLPDYHPDRQTLLIAKKYSRSIEYKKRALRKIPLQGLYLMGSVGTIGQTAESDLDFWLCHEHELDERELQLLQEKVELIEQFGLELGLEVHFFLMDAVAFKSGVKLTISSESSGSAQHHLLLEEFYRTGIRIAGRPPLWWVVPAEHEHEYRNYTEELIEKRFIDPLDWLDFGGMEKVPPEEFFGAAHWQLYKGIESPYKAILKILLMESYAADYPEIPWLSLISKQAIFNGDSNVVEIDPYVLIYRQVESYLSMRGEYERLDLARRCFYFKVNLPLSRLRRRNRDSWKEERLRALVDEWQWDKAKLALLDSRDKWKLEQVLRERNLLVRELTHSYRVLMNFARSNAATGGIDPRELNLLGRKLYAALERRPGKIDLINPGISRDLIEPRLCFRHDVRGEQQNWHLYRSDPEIETLERPLKTTTNLVELLSWCHCNGIISRNAHLSIRPFDAPVSIGDLRQLLDIIQQALPDHLDTHPPMADLERQPQARVSIAFVNVGYDPLENLSRAGLQLTSKRSDPFSFSGSHINLAQRIDHLTINSWGEVEISSFVGTDGLLEMFCQFLQMTRNRKEQINMQSHGFGSPRSQNIASRVQQVANRMSDCFLHHGCGMQSHYLLEIETGFALIYFNNDKFSYLLIDSLPDLFDKLGEYHEHFIPVVFDEQALRDHPLPVIYGFNKPDVVQLFAWKMPDGAQLFVLDENGAMFHQTVKGADERHLLIQQQRFFNSMAERRSLLSADTTAHLLLYPPDYYQVVQDRKGDWQVREVQLPTAPIVDNYLDLELATGRNFQTRNGYSIYCGEREFDYLQLKDDIFSAVAEHILSMRKNAAAYPVYLTSIAPTGMDDQTSWSTINLLNFKKRLEGQINIALNKLASK